MALTRALLRGGPVLVLDEPTTGLDPETAHQPIRTLRLLAVRGRTVVLVTHDRDLPQYADQVIELRAGRVHQVRIDPEAGGRMMAAERTRGRQARIPR